jgi:hypothetical protein
MICSFFICAAIIENRHFIIVIATPKTCYFSNHFLCQDFASRLTFETVVYLACLVALANRYAVDVKLLSF